MRVEESFRRTRRIFVVPFGGVCSGEQSDGAWVASPEYGESSRKGEELRVTQHVNWDRNDRHNGSAACYTDSSDRKRRSFHRYMPVPLILIFAPPPHSPPPPTQ